MSLFQVPAYSLALYHTHPRERTSEGLALRQGLFLVVANTEHLTLLSLVYSVPNWDAIKLMGECLS